MVVVSGKLMYVLRAVTVGVFAATALLNAPSLYCLRPHVTVSWTLTKSRRNCRLRVKPGSIPTISLPHSAKVDGINRTELKIRKKER
jgi:hypothetical protein